MQFAGQLPAQLRWLKFTEIHGACR